MTGPALPVHLLLTSTVQGERGPHEVLPRGLAALEGGRVVRGASIYELLKGRRGTGLPKAAPSLCDTGQVAQLL